MGYCNPCEAKVPDPELLNHLRIYHPADMPELWPDGQPILWENDWNDIHD